jgi:hypothetical protein
MRHVPVPGTGDDYIGRLGKELAAVGIRGRARARILAEATDHLTEGDEEQFGDPRELAQLFADELATQATTRAAFGTFAALGLACPQISFAAGLLTLLRAERLRKLRAAPAAELALLARRTNAALAFGAASMFAFAVYALDYHAAFSRWQVLAAVTGAVLLTLPVGAAANASRGAGAVRSSVPGPAGDMFDDLPLRLPRRPWLACFVLAGALAVLLLAAGGLEEGPRNAVAEIVLVVGSFAALGRRLGLR